MNIFCLDKNPIIAANLMCDQHVKSKMIVESAQMLANCFDLEKLKESPSSKKGEPRKYSYYNHPCSVWVRTSTDNMRWLTDHAFALYDEKCARGYTNPHYSMQFIEWCASNIYNSVVTKAGLTDFAIAINAESKCRKTEGFNDLSTVQKYQRYYQYDKPFATYTNRVPPTFMSGMVFNSKKNTWMFETV